MDGVQPSTQASPWKTNKTMNDNIFPSVPAMPPCYKKYSSILWRTTILSLWNIRTLKLIYQSWWCIVNLSAFFTVVSNGLWNQTHCTVQCNSISHWISCIQIEFVNAALHNRHPEITNPNLERLKMFQYMEKTPFVKLYPSLQHIYHFIDDESGHLLISLP